MRWLPVVGYEGLYEISETGSVRRIGAAHGARVGKTVSQRLGRGEYPKVRLSKDCRNRGFYVHRLVAAAFLGPCPNGKEVNHKDRNRLNPHVGNLEYVTRSQNSYHMYRNGVVALCGEAKVHKVTEKDIVAIRASDLSCRSLGSMYGVHHSTISAIKRKKKWAHVD